MLYFCRTRGLDTRAKNAAPRGFPAHPVSEVVGISPAPLTERRKAQHGPVQRLDWRYGGRILRDFGGMYYFCPLTHVRKTRLEAGAAAAAITVAAGFATFAAVLSKIQSVDQRMRMRCRLSPTADVPSHTSGAAVCRHNRTHAPQQTIGAAAPA